MHNNGLVGKNAEKAVFSWIHIEKLGIQNHFYFEFEPVKSRKKLAIRARSC